MTYVPAESRYDRMTYRRSGRSGLTLPAVSLGLWQNFGHDRPLDTSRAIVRRAFDLGITHFDLANNYGPPYGSAEENFGRLMEQDLRPFRDELVISTKAGYDMWPGPYGDLGSRKYLLSSLDQSLRAHGPRLRRHLLLAPLRPGHAARGDDGRARHGGAPGQGALRRASRPTRRRRRWRPSRSCATSARRCSSTSLRTRCSTGGSRVASSTRSTSVGVGCIVFSPLAQGMLTDKYLNGDPAGLARGANGSFSPKLLTDEALARDPRH